MWAIMPIFLICSFEKMFVTTKPLYKIQMPNDKVQMSKEAQSSNMRLRLRLRLRMKNKVLNLSLDLNL
jgi:hypothetical protein